MNATPAVAAVCLVFSTTTAYAAEVRPGHSLESAIKRANGGTLIVHGGTYRGKVDVRLRRGTVIRAARGERVVLRGLLRVRGSDWTMRGINVRWPRRGAGKDDHMVKFTGGHGWRFTNAEVWGARSYAAILVARNASRWTLRRLYVHDTAESNGTNQDHLVYVNSSGRGGLIARSLFVNSPNGRGIKIGPPSGGSDRVGSVTIRYNTFYKNKGPSNIQLSNGASNNRIYRNLMAKSSSANITSYQLNGRNNVAQRNAGDASPVVERGITSRHNIRKKVRFRSTRNGRRGFVPENQRLQSYGFFARR